MIAELERLASLHQNGHLDDAEFKLAKEKLLGGAESNDQLALRLELTEAQIKLSEIEKVWPAEAPSQWINFSALSLGLLMLYVLTTFFMNKLCSEFLMATTFMAIAASIYLIITSASAIRGHQALRQRFLAAQSEKSAMRSRIALLQQQLS